MNNRYQDILALTDRKPVWFDENAVPRFCEFTPGAVANIYANEVALVNIRCQGCQAPFNVGFSISTHG